MSDDSIDIEFGATTSGFNAGADDVKNKLEGVNEEVEKAEELFKYLGERMLEVFAIHEIVDFVEKISEVGEQIERMSTMTGLTQQTVQTLGYAMERTGGSAEGVSSMMMRLERNIETAIGSSGRAREGFQQLGISMDDLKHMSIDDLVLKIANGFRNLHDPVQRAALAVQIGGRSFGQMLPAILESADGIEEFRAKLKTLNDDLSEKTVSALSDTHGKLVDLGRAAQGAGVQGMLTFKGAIDGVLEDVTYAIVDIGKFIGWFRELQVVVGVDVVDAFLFLGKEVERITAEMSYYAKRIEIDWQEAGRIIKDVATRNWDDVSLAATVAAAKTEQATRNLEAGLQIAEGRYKDLTASALQAGNAILTADNAMDKSANDQKANRTGLGGGAGGIDTTGDSEFLNAMRQNMKMIEMQDQVAKKSLEQQKQEWHSLTSVIEGPFDNALQGVLTGTETWQQAMANVFDQLALSAIKSIANIILEWAIFEAATEGQGSWSDFMTLEGKGGGGGGLGKFLGSFDVGSSNIPQTGLAMIHQGEMILPPDISAQVRGGQATIGAGSAFGSGGGSNSTVNMQVTALDAKSIITALNNPSVLRQLSKNIGGYMANNPSTRGNY